MTTREEFGKLVDNFEKQFETVCIRGSYNIIGQDPDTARAALLAAYDAQATSIADWSKSAGYYHNLSVAYAQKIQELRAALKAVLHSLNAHTEVVWIIPPYQAEAIHESAQERLLSVLEGEA